MNLETELLSKAEIQIANYREYKQRTGANFNVFKVLNRATDEVYGHSAFIAELLNPAGSHGQGDIFLREFIVLLGIEDDAHGIDLWQATVEESRDVDGRIDILLVGQGDDGRRFGIAIENKIYANDEPKQLSRYWDYLNWKFGACRSAGKPDQNCYLLYYLTLGGYRPSDQSVENIPKSELAYEGEENLEAPVRLLSYAFHISEWLKSCHEKVAAYPYAREVMGQYIDIVHTLTGNGGGMSESLQSLLDTPEKLFAAAQLSNAIIKFKQSIVSELWDAIDVEWKAQTTNDASKLTGILVPNIYLKDRSKLKEKSEEYFTKQRNVPRWFGLTSRAYAFKGIPVGIEIRFDNNFYVGIYGVKNEKVFDHVTVKDFYMNYHPPKDCSLGDWDKNAAEERIYINTPIRFDSDSKGVFNLVESAHKQKLVDTIFEIAEGIVEAMSKLGLESK